MAVLRHSQGFDWLQCLGKAVGARLRSAKLRMAASPSQSPLLAGICRPWRRISRTSLCLNVNKNACEPAAMQDDLEMAGKQTGLSAGCRGTYCCLKS